MIFLLCFLFLSSNLEFYVNKTKISELSINDAPIESKKIYNYFRKYEKEYKVIPLVTLLEIKFGADWKKAKAIIFLSSDGFRQKNLMPVFLKLISDPYKQPYIAISEIIDGKDTMKFSSFKKGRKTIDPGPYYMIWSGYGPQDNLKINDDPKWPYQLKQIILTQ